MIINFQGEKLKNDISIDFGQQFNFTVELIKEKSRFDIYVDNIFKFGIGVPVTYLHIAKVIVGGDMKLNFAGFISKGR